MGSEIRYPREVDWLCGQNHDPALRRLVDEAFSRGRESQAARIASLEAENQRLQAERDEARALGRAEAAHILMQCSPDEFPEIDYNSGKVSLISSIGTPSGEYVADWDTSAVLRLFDVPESANAMIRSVWERADAMYWDTLEERNRLRDENEALQARMKAMMPLFQEARDALPAISVSSAKLHNISLTLADRMDDIGIPDRWAAHPANPPRRSGDDRQL